ncbi:hypothetical protein ACHAXT_002854 [Thalassiosira profunda]
MSCPFAKLHAGNSSSSTASTETSASSTPAIDGSTINRLVTFMTGSPDAAFLVDREGKIVYRNKASQLMFLTDVNAMSLCSIFSFAPTSPRGVATTCWDDIANSLANSEPQHHNVYVTDNDGSRLDFRINLVKLPPDFCGEANRDVYACAYVTPAHDHTNGRRTMASIAEEGTEHSAEKSSQLRQHMQDVVQASLDPMVGLHEDGTIAVANDPAVHLFGYTRDELLGKEIATICPTAREVQNLLDFMNAPSINQKQKTTAATKDGQELSIELGLSLNQSFAASKQAVYFAHMKDLSQMEEHRSEIEHKDNLCQAMINASFDPMFGIDQRGKIIVVNEAACQAFGYTRAEFLEQNISMICNEKDAASHDKYMRRYLRTGKKRVVGRKRAVVAQRKDGSEFHVELGVSEVTLPDGEKMFCGYVRDRTQERLDKQNLRRKEAVIQDEFFTGLSPEDARGTMRRKLSDAAAQARATMQ